MAVKLTTDKLSYARNFGHCIISWKIKNFPLAICNSGAEISTPEFEVTSLKVTRWKFGFRVESDGSTLRIFLRRIGGELREKFKVSWKITILNGEDEVTFISENESDFSRNSECKIAVTSAFDIFKALPAEKSYEVNAVLQMIVFTSTTMYIPTPDDDGIVALIDDMKVIAKEGYLHDLTIMLIGKDVKAHKAVVCPRSKRLSPATRCETRKVNLHVSNAESVNCIIFYLYTGDLKFILDPPSITIYEYIVHLDIKELRNAYPQEKISFETVAEATNCQFRWIIQDFNCSDELRESEIYEEEGTGVKWKLRIYPKDLDEETELKKKYIYIEALVESSDKPQDVFVNFIAKNDKGMITVDKKAYGRVTSGKKLGVFFMRLGGPSMAKSVIDNVLDIGFVVYTATGEVHSKMIKYEPPVPLTITNFDTCKMMTDYMGLLQTKGLYSDITLVVQDQEIKAHKFLLGGRSEVLSRMIEGMKNDSTTLPLPNMHKHVFRVFLDYLYKAVITDTGISVLIHLYDIARHFLVNSLQTICVTMLENALSKESCCYLLMFADERQLHTFKEDILKYLSLHREEIIRSEGWRNMEEKNRHLFYEVICYLGNQPVVPARDVQR